ncbi:MAG: glycosyltransferase family 2 protein [Silicimonas sp.]|nr:glycosyltransferase family 2 protein [Silicimonas sp.]
MRIASLADLKTTPEIGRLKGPVAAVIAEDEVEVAATLRHNRALGFRHLLLFAPDELDLPPEETEGLIRINAATLGRDATARILNALVQALPEKTWLYYCYNAEFLYFPFCETRTIGEMLTFHAEERRFAMLTYVIDLYAGDLGRATNAVALDDALLDRSGYYALARQGAEGPKDRQLDFFGGLRWRFEEHIEEPRRRIDRISLVRSRRDITFRPDHTWSDEELNTYSCPWHHNLTAAIASFRTAKALRINPASRFAIDTFRWHNSVPFEWNSQQLLDLGLMEPGQWF